jgi:uncharacterized protein (DUF1501 family)
VTGSDHAFSCATPTPDARPCGCPGTEPPGLARRTLLRRMATGGALAAALAVSDNGGLATRYAFAATPTGYTGDVLVVLSLRGGFDGLNVIVPSGDPDYLKARPGIGIPPSVLIPAGGIFGLHPALRPLKKFWDAGTFGAVHAVGQPAPTRSHFQAMAELERAAPGSSLRTGWLDRTIGARAGGTVFQATQIGSTQVSSPLTGSNRALSLQTINSFGLAGAAEATERALWTKTLRSMHGSARTAVARPALAALGAVATTSAMKAATYAPANGATYPTNSPLSSALRDVARLVKQRVGLQVACVDEGDWDMHAGMGTHDAGWLHDHLSELAHALAAFATDLGKLMNRVTVVTLSEFGRRVTENGSGGVDHGNGNAVLMLGGGIVGGRVHGAWPGLGSEDLVDGDLAGSTDYRLVLGEILTKRCGATSLAEVFPGLSGEPIGVARP